MSTPWYRCFPRDFNEGMVGLTLEERGAYITLLNLIYTRGGPIPEDGWWITSQLACTTRTWTKLRAALLLKGKLYAVQIDGENHLMNARAAAEIHEREQFSKKKATAGAKGGRNSKAVLNEINAEREASLKHPESKQEAIHSHIHILSVVPSNEETTGGEPPGIDPNARAWRDGVDVLVVQGGMKPPAARTFFGRLLKDHALEPRDLLSAIGQLYNHQSGDPQAFLKAAAKARDRRTTGPPKRVGFV